MEIIVANRMKLLSVSVFIVAGLVSPGAVGLDAAPNETQPSTSQTSGIEGTIFVSPIRPGPIRIDTPSKGPARNVTFVVKKEETTIASFTTDAEGNFKVSLPPGHYVVSRENAGKIGHWRFETDVAPAAMPKVQWTADSGMR